MGQRLTENETVIAGTLREWSRFVFGKPPPPAGGEHAHCHAYLSSLVPLLECDKFEGVKRNGGEEECD